MLSKKGIQHEIVVLAITKITKLWHRLKRYFKLNEESWDGRENMVSRII